MTLTMDDFADVRTLEEIIHEIHPIAARVARSVAGHFGEYVEASDLVQEMMLWTLTHEDKVRSYLTPTVEDEKCVIGRRKLHTAYRRLARGIGYKAKANRLGFSTDDLHFYSGIQIEELLPRALNYEAWLPSVDNDSGKSSSKPDPALGNDLLALLADVRGAYEKLSPGDRDLLYARFVHAPPIDELVLAERLDITRQAVNSRVHRALGKMVDRLGGPRPDWNEND